MNQKQGSFGINGSINDPSVKEMPHNGPPLNKSMTTTTHCPDKGLRRLRANISLGRVVSLSWEVHF